MYIAHYSTNLSLQYFDHINVHFQYFRQMDNGLLSDPIVSQTVVNTMYMLLK
jgi:hypothetical protein